MIRKNIFCQPLHGSVQRAYSTSFLNILLLAEVNMLSLADLPSDVVRRILVVTRQSIESARLVLFTSHISFVPNYRPTSSDIASLECSGHRASSFHQETARINKETHLDNHPYGHNGDCAFALSIQEILWSWLALLGTWAWFERDWAWSWFTIWNCKKTFAATLGWILFRNLKHAVHFESTTA